MPVLRVKSYFVTTFLYSLGTSKCKQVRIFPHRCACIEDNGDHYQYHIISLIFAKLQICVQHYYLFLY